MASPSDRRQTPPVHVKSVVAVVAGLSLLATGSACKSRKTAKPPTYPNNGYVGPYYPPQPTYTPPYTGPVYTSWTIPAPTTSVVASSSASSIAPTASVAPASSSAPPPTGPGVTIIDAPANATVARVPGPEAVIDKASVVGTLDDAKPHVEKWQTPFLRCYALGLVNEPAMRGTVQLKLKVGTNGRITDAWKDAGGTVTYDVAACMLERTLADQFTPPKEPATIQVHVLLNPDHPKSG